MPKLSSFQTRASGLGLDANVGLNADIRLSFEPSEVNDDLNALENDRRRRRRLAGILWKLRHESSLNTYYSDNERAALMPQQTPRSGALNRVESSPWVRR